MVQQFRQLTFNLTRRSGADRRREGRTRTEPTPALLTDIYRDRIPVTVLNVSRSGLGVKVDERFDIDFPVLIECEGLLIIGIVRHCMKATGGGYILGMKLDRMVEAVARNVPEDTSVSLPAMVRPILGGDGFRFNYSPSMKDACMA
jgi:hypothetical protein